MPAPRSATIVAVCASLIIAGPLAQASARSEVPLASATIERSTALATATRTPFVRNDGQIAERSVRYYARSASGNVYVTAAGEVVYRVVVQAGDGELSNWAFRESFPRRETGIVGALDPTSTRVSSYRGIDASAWKMALPTFNGIDLGEPYPGTRVTLRMNGQEVEKLFRIAPGSDPGAIKVGIDGVDSLAVDASGKLVLATSKGLIVMTAPVAYQVFDGRQRSVDAAYRLIDDRHYGFRLGAYDEARDVIIDPMLAATYLGGHHPNVPGNYDNDIITSMVLANGDIYVAGVTQSPDFPIILGFQDTYHDGFNRASPDGFIARLSGDLSTLIASTYIGTDYFDNVTALAADTDGTIIATGQAGYGFPVTPGAYNWSGTTPTGGGYVARFSPDLSMLIASAVVVPVDHPSSLTFGGGDIIFSGSTSYDAFPITPGAYLSICCQGGLFGIPDPAGFIGRISSDLSSLHALTYTDGDTASHVTLTSDGDLLVTDGYDSAVTGTIERFDANLTTLKSSFSFYPGSMSGSSRTYFNGIAPGDGFVIVAGQTYMDDLPATPGAYDADCGVDGDCDGVGSNLVPRADGFVAIFSNDLSQMRALTYIGGSNHESIRSVARMPNGDVLVTGETISVDFPTVGDAADTTCGTDGACDPVTIGMYTNPVPDGFVARFSPTLSQLEYSSYLGGSGDDHPRTLVVDGSGRVLVAGGTDSMDFPTTPGAFDETWNGGTADAFIASFDTGTTGTDMIFDCGFEE